MNRLCEDFPYDPTIDIGQAKVAPRMAIGEPLVIEAE